MNKTDGTEKRDNHAVASVFFDFISDDVKTAGKKVLEDLKKQQGEDTWEGYKLLATDENGNAVVKSDPATSNSRRL